MPDDAAATPAERSAPPDLVSAHGTPSRPATEGSVYTGGAGLFQQGGTRGDSPFPGWTTPLLVLVSLLCVVGTAGVLVAANPAFSQGKATGTANQIGQVGAASAASEEPTNLSAEAQEGKQLIGSKCGGCHVVPGIAAAKGTVGPNLAGVAVKNKIAGGAVDNTGPRDLKKWVLNPPGVKPGTTMPNLGLTEDEADRIVAYLQLLGGPGGAAKPGSAH